MQTKIQRLLLICLLFFIGTSKAVSNLPTEGKTSMVTSEQHYATEVGLRILQQGGNAIDAAVAMGYALAVVHPCCGNIGGGGLMLIRFKDGRTTFLNFREKAPLALKPSLFLSSKEKVIKEKLSTGYLSGSLRNPYLSVGVPGTVLGLNTALQKYGCLSLREVIAPAIKLAKQGYRLLPGDIIILKKGEKDFKSEANVAAIFLKNDHSYEVGDRLIQKNLANTLTTIAQDGSNGFYRGKIAKAIVMASKMHGGVMTKQDLANYTVQELHPISCRYRGYTIITSPPPSAGGTTLCEILNIVEGYPLAKLGFHSTKSAHFTIEAMRYTFADRRFLGDPDFVKNPISKLLSKKHAEKIRQKIIANKASNSRQIGFFSATKEGNQTTSYAVLDKWGNAVSVTYTLNDYFGAKIIPGNTGFFLNNVIADFTIKPATQNNYGLWQSEKNILVPGKRPLSSMTPTIITKGNQLYMVIGTPGGATIPTQLVNVIQNVIDYKMNIQAAINAPRFHMQWLPDIVYVEPFTFSKDTKRLLEKMGYHFKLGSPYGTCNWGAVMGILIDPISHQILGASDARRSAGLAKGD